MDQIILEDELPYYYQGYLDVDQWKSDQYYSTITINYDLHPFKRMVRSSIEPWLWDPFDFKYGVISADEESDARTLERCEFNRPLGGNPATINAYPFFCPISDEAVIPNIYVHSGTNVYYVYDADDVDYMGTGNSGNSILQKLSIGDNKNLFHCIIPSRRDIKDKTQTKACLNLFGTNAVVSIIYNRGYL